MGPSFVCAWAPVFEGRETEPASQRVRPRQQAGQGSQRRPPQARSAGPDALLRLTRERPRRPSRWKSRVSSRCCCSLARLASGPKWKREKQPKDATRKQCEVVCRSRSLSHTTDADTKASEHHRQQLLAEGDRGPSPGPSSSAPPKRKPHTRQGRVPAPEQRQVASAAAHTKTATTTDDRRPTTDQRPTTNDQRRLRAGGLGSRRRQRQPTRPDTPPHNPACPPGPEDGHQSTLASQQTNFIPRPRSLPSCTCQALSLSPTRGPHYWPAAASREQSDPAQPVCRNHPLTWLGSPAGSVPSPA